MKGKRVITLVVLQLKTLEKLYRNCMDIEKAQIVATDLVYWININIEVEYTVNYISTCLAFKHTLPKKQGSPS